jgi:hypothetical protein
MRWRRTEFWDSREGTSDVAKARIRTIEMKPPIAKEVVEAGGAVTP